MAGEPARLEGGEEIYRDCVVLDAQYREKVRHGR